MEYSYSIESIRHNSKEDYILVMMSQDGICDLMFDYKQENLQNYVDTNHPSHTKNLTTHQKLWMQQLSSYLCGTAGYPTLPVDIKGTSFNQEVWSALRRIESGKTKTYSEIAIELGSPRASRAVGNACAKNPVAIVIPCHRVLHKGRKNLGNLEDLGNFAWGVERKHFLLGLEQQI